MNKTELNNIDFYESRERYALTELFQLHLKPMFDGYTTELHLSKTFRQQVKSEVYDAVMYVRDKVTHNLLYKFIIEVKYRDSEYETLMIESKRHNELSKTFKQAVQYKSPDEDIAVLYVNFTPTGTYVFNLSSDRVKAFLSDRKNLLTQKHTQYTFEVEK